MPDARRGPGPARPADDPRRGPGGPRLIDLVGMVVGFGTASLLLRSLWPSSRSMSPGVAAVAGGLLLWLGVAMAGPVLLLIDRRGFSDATRQLSWAQVAWLLIGSYWLALTILVVPTRLAMHPMLGVLPVLAALLLRLAGPRTAEARLRAKSWTDHVAVALMATWPVAWAAMILLGKTLF